MTDSAHCHIQLFASPAPVQVRWRLLSGNNREMGRAVSWFADAETCRMNVKLLQNAHHQLKYRVRRLRPSWWTWEIWLDGASVITAGHPFDRMIRCEQAVELFLLRFAEAPVGGSVMDSGARRWRLPVTSLRVDPRPAPPAGDRSAAGSPGAA